MGSGLRSTMMPHGSRLTSKKQANGRAICQCTKHDNIFNPNGEPSTVWDAAHADEIGGDCSGLDLPYTTAVRLADIDGKETSKALMVAGC